MSDNIKWTDMQKLEWEYYKKLNYPKNPGDGDLGNFEWRYMKRWLDEDEKINGYWNKLSQRD